MTNPFRCRLEDDRLYAVKGRGALPRGLIAEAVCFALARELGLPVPSGKIAAVEADLVDALGDDEFRSSVGAGFAFASHWHEPVVPVSPSSLTAIDQRLLARIYAFDHWVKNGDRSLTELGGNPNLLIDLSDSSLLVIDHNLAFSTSYTSQELKWHACRNAWLDENQNLVFNQECETAFKQARRILPSIFDTLPCEWVDSEPNLLGEIEDILRRSDEVDFWEEMK